MSIMLPTPLISNVGELVDHLLTIDRDVLLKKQLYSLPIVEIGFNKSRETKSSITANIDDLYKDTLHMYAYWLKIGQTNYSRHSLYLEEDDEDFTKLKFLQRKIRVEGVLQDIKDLNKRLDEFKQDPTIETTKVLSLDSW